MLSSSSLLLPPPSAFRRHSCEINFLSLPHLVHQKRGKASRMSLRSTAWNRSGHSASFPTAWGWMSAWNSSPSLGAHSMGWGTFSSQCCSSGRYWLLFTKGSAHSLETDFLNGRKRDLLALGCMSLIHMQKLLTGIRWHDSLTGAKLSA